MFGKAWIPAAAVAACAAAAALAVDEAVRPTAALAQQAVTLVDFGDFSPHELRSAAFVLDEPQRVRIDAVGADHRGGRGKLLEKLGQKLGNWIDSDGEREDQWWRGDAWILDARTRRVVWQLSDADTDGGRDGARSFSGSVSLPAGSYEAYFASYSGTSYVSDGDKFVVERGGVRRTGRGRWEDDGIARQFKLVVRGDGRRGGDALRLREELSRGAIVSFTGVEAGDARRIGFELDRPVEVEIYAVGEARRGEAFDYGWIINADTRERVWTFDYEHSEPAGGAAKNRMVRTVRRLPAGRYAAFFATDDSHDAGDWNAGPPRDPASWGLTVRLLDPEDRSAVRTFRYESAPPDRAIVALTALGDGEARSRGFTLTRPMDVRIYALGEGRADQMFDYGWIVDARSHRRVWEMRYAETEHAGGADKNRLVDRVVRLEPGSYLVNFVTDGSHSYDAWNSGAPIDGEMWGITVLPARGDVDPDVVRPYDENDDEAVVTRLVRMRDDEHARASFRLERDGEVRVYALGEGTEGQMYDYGWIEDARTGRVVWEMTFRRTEHAGGAEKNRMADEVIPLRAGEYVVHYKSDGSHSFGAWNSDAPADPVNWGVTVYRVR